jgi:hypothetical protein
VHTSLPLSNAKAARTAISDFAKPTSESKRSSKKIGLIMVKEIRAMTLESLKNMGED